MQSIYSRSLCLLLFITTCCYSQRSITEKTTDGPPNYVPVQNPDCSSSNYTFTHDLYLAWSDEFNGTSLDLQKWKVGEPWGIIYTGTDPMPVWADPNEISFTGNSIKLGCNYNPNTNIPNGSNIESRNFSTGIISSLEQFGYGYYEISCKIPRIAKHHPAFWAYGDCNQEIDVFEFVGIDYIASHQNIGTPDKLSGCTPFP